MMKLRWWPMVLAGGLLMQAQEISQRPFRDFRAPQLDEEGNLKWLVRGDSGRARGDNLIDLNGVTVEFYKGETVDMRLRAERATYDRQRKRAETKAAVEIEAPQRFVVTARGMDWTAEKNLIRLHSEVKVVLSHDAARRGQLFPEGEQ